MTETKQDIGTDEDDPYYQGDAIQVGKPVIPIWEDDAKSTRKDLTGITADDIEFGVRKRAGGTDIIDEDTQGVTITIEDFANGEMRVFIEGDVTSSMKGEHRWYLRVTDSTSNPDTVTTGTFEVTPR